MRISVLLPTIIRDLTPSQKLPLIQFQHRSPFRDTFGWWRGLRVTSAFLPGPASSDLKLKGKTQKGSDHNQKTQHTQILKGWANRHRANNIGSNKKFQTQQNSLAEIASKSPITLLKGSLFDYAQEKDDGCCYRTYHDDTNSNRFDSDSNPFYRLIKALEAYG